MRRWFAFISNVINIKTIHAGYFDEVFRFSQQNKSQMQSSEKRNGGNLKPNQK